MKKILILSSSLLFLYFTACGALVESNRPVSSGIMTLDTKDPGVEANRILSRELNRSLALFELFKRRGAPNAFEWIESDPPSAHLILFYPREKKVFTADRIVKGGTVHDWNISGPFPMDQSDYAGLASSDASLVGDPVFFIGGEHFKFSQKKFR